MRLLATVITLGMAGLAGLAGHALWVMSGMGGAQARSVLLAPAGVPPRSTGAPSDQPGTQLPASPLVTHWPPLFGEKQPPISAEPQPPTQAPMPPKPPLASLGYALNGVVTIQGAVWAMVSHPTGGRLLHPGDVLEPGITVARIDAEGLWVSRDGDAPELLAFPEPPVR